MIICFCLSSCLLDFRIPKMENVKLNIDAALKDGEGVGFDVVCRDFEGNLVAAACKFTQIQVEPKVAEALCLRWTMELAADLCLTKVEVESDCSVLCDAWHKAKESNSYFNEIVSDCIGLCNNFIFCSLFHVRREGNKLADFVAKLAFDLGDRTWIEDIPPGV